MSDLLAVIALAFRSCTEPLCCWEVRLDDGTLYRDEQGPEASFEIPRQGFYFEARAAAGPCSEPGLWSAWRRFDWMHPADVDADGMIGPGDLVLGYTVSSEFGRYPDASEYSYCLPAHERVAPPEIVELPPAPEVIPPEEIALEEITSGGSSVVPVVATDTPLAAEHGALYVAAIASKPHSEVTSVSGLGLVWTPVRSQCGGRNQTGVSIWQARGEPMQDGVVTATLSSVPREAIIAASRYSATAVVGSVASANTLGVAGACSGGTDAAAYALELDTTETDSLVQAWVAMRNREHFPGSGFAELREVHQGSSAGDQAGLALAESAVDTPTRVDVSGSFSSTVDWAAVAIEIRRSLASE